MRIFLGLGKILFRMAKYRTEPDRRKKFRTPGGHKRFKQLTGRISRFSANDRKTLRRFSRTLRGHGIKRGMKWIRKWGHRLSPSLLFRIFGEGAPGQTAGRWKKRKGVSNSFIKRVKHGRLRFAHYWTPRTGHRIRQLGKGARKGFLSHAMYKTLKAYGKGH